MSVAVLATTYYDK